MLCIREYTFHILRCACRGGYQTVFNNIAKIESAHGTKIHLNSRIDKVKTSWFTRTLRISIEHKGWVHENFDAVIVATRPKQVTASTCLPMLLLYTVKVARDVLGMITPFRCSKAAQLARSLWGFLRLYSHFQHTSVYVGKHSGAWENDVRHLDDLGKIHHCSC